MYISLNSNIILTTSQTFWSSPSSPVGGALFLAVVAWRGSDVRSLLSMQPLYHWGKDSIFQPTSPPHAQTPSVHVQLPMNESSAAALTPPAPQTHTHLPSLSCFTVCGLIAPNNWPEHTRRKKNSHVVITSTFWPTASLLWATDIIIYLSSW